MLSKQFQYLHTGSRLYPDSIFHCIKYLTSQLRGRAKGGHTYISEDLLFLSRTTLQYIFYAVNLENRHHLVFIKKTFFETSHGT